MSSSAPLTLYVRAGSDNKKYGACPFCQRIFMVLMLKASKGALKFRVATVSASRLPSELKALGLRNLPALVHGDEGIDTVEEIVDYIEASFPVPRLTPLDNAQAAHIDTLTRNIFSKFCYYIKAVSKDSHALECELGRLDAYLCERESVFLCGDALTHADCETLPKLHHVRVAAERLKRFHIPSAMAGVWSYLNAAYNDDVFAMTCPPDQEIVLHWATRPDVSPKLLSVEAHAALASDAAKPCFSFDVPAFATPITLQ